MYSNIDYKQKYLKYKQKYLGLKMGMYGGMQTEKIQRANPFLNKTIYLLQGISGNIENNAELKEQLVQYSTGINPTIKVFLNAQYFEEGFKEKLDVYKSLYENLDYDDFGNIIALKKSGELSEEEANLLKQVALNGSKKDRREPGKSGKSDIEQLYKELDPTNEMSRRLFTTKVNEFLTPMSQMKMAARNGDGPGWKKNEFNEEQKKKIANRACFITGIGTLINSNNRTGRVPDEHKTEKYSYGYDHTRSGDTFTAIDRNLELILKLYMRPDVFRSDLGRGGRLLVPDKLKLFVGQFIGVLPEIEDQGTNLSSMLADLQGAIQIFLITRGYDVDTEQKLQPYIQDFYKIVEEAIFVCLSKKIVIKNPEIVNLMKIFIKKHEYPDELNAFHFYARNIPIFIQTDYFLNREEPDDAMSILFLLLTFNNISISFDTVEIKRFFETHVSYYTQITDITPTLI